MKPRAWAICGLIGSALSASRFPTWASAFRAQKRDVSVTCALGSAIPNRIQRRLIYLSLSWADAVSHDCIAHTQRFLHSLSRISRSLVLHLGVELSRAAMRSAISSATQFRMR